MHPKELLQGEQLGADGVGDQRIATEPSSSLVGLSLSIWWINVDEDWCKTIEFVR